MPSLFHVPQPLERIGAGLGSKQVLALEIRQAQPVGPVALAHAPLHAVLVGDDAGQALLVLLVDPVEPERCRLVDVLVGGDDEVLPRVAGAGGARPAVVAGRLEPPEVRGVHRQRIHRRLPPVGCSRLRVPSSSGPSVLRPGPPSKGFSRLRVRGMLAAMTWTETYRGTVHRWEVDNVDHFTVAYYFARFEDATLGLLQALGLGPEALGTRRAAIIAECRVRYLRELRVGDLLSIRSGVISADETGLTLGHQVVDAGDEALCTTVEQRMVIAGSDRRTPRPLSRAEQDQTLPHRVDWEGGPAPGVAPKSDR